jgi:hypothetical protein
MTEAVMSVGAFRSSEATWATEQEHPRPDAEKLRQPRGWNPKNFAREQIRGLVLQTFFSSGARPVRQVVFSSLEPETDVRGLCWRVAEALSRETPASIAVAGRYPRLIRGETQLEREDKPLSTPMRQTATRVRGNLWLVTDRTSDGDPITAASLHSFLGEVRRQFEYSIVQGPTAGGSNQATAMAQFADGIILVLSAQCTRRATARKVKETLEAAKARLLGTVLGDRVFPIPEAIYRRL